MTINWKSSKEREAYDQGWKDGGNFILTTLDDVKKKGEELLIQYKDRIKNDVCSECFGWMCYWTEWSDRADKDPELIALVLERPEPPDGTVLIRCWKCNNSS